MPISITCPNCNKTHSAPDSLAGRAAKCKCGTIIQVPESFPAASAQPQKLASIFDELGHQAAPTATLTSAPPRHVRSAPVWTSRRIAFTALCVVATIFFVSCGGALYSLSRLPQPSQAAKEPFVYGVHRLPKLPDRSVPVVVGSGVLKEELSLGNLPYLHQPGYAGKLWIYLPKGEHAPKSLPCILITAAGSNLLTGMALREGDRAEHLPYAQVGFAVVAYELDGDANDSRAANPIKHPYQQFRASQAGLVNARIALEFALQKMPEVDPTRIYAAGHSSAATHALLFAAHEPRLAGVVAHAPVIDVPERFGFSLRAMTWQLPGVVDFATQCSPHTHVERLRCPVFLFQAEDDLGCRPACASDFLDRLKRQGTDSTFIVVPTGGHYDSMINEGVPAAIKWLHERNRR